MSLDTLPSQTMPHVDGLSRALPTTDHRSLMLLSRDDLVMRYATSKPNVKRLWDVCTLPDYRKIAPAQHADIIAQLYRDLCTRGRVDETYMADQVARADITDGEIDTLSARVAQIRTWTYVANRPGWLADPAHWQEKTRGIEDRLSDALHDRLTKRFVDRRTSVLMKRLRENVMLEAYVGFDGTVTVEGHHVGSLSGFRFTPDLTAGGPDAKAVQGAAQKALGLEFEARAARFAIASNGDLSLGADGVVRWLGAAVAQLASSDDWLKPRAVILADEQLMGSTRDRVAMRIDRFVAHTIETHIKPLQDLAAAEQLLGFAKGLAFRLVESGGVVERRNIAEEMKSLDQTARSALRRLGVRFGFYYVFMPALIKPQPAEVITLLWALKNDAKDRPGYGEPVALLAAGRTSFAPNAEVTADFYRLAGFAVLGNRAVRFDILERLADQIRPALYWKEGIEVRPEAGFGKASFFVTPGMMSILGATHDDMVAVLSALGYRSQPMPKIEFETKLAEVKLIVPAKPVDDTAPKFEVVIAAPHAQAVAEAMAEAAAQEAVAEEDPVVDATIAEALQPVETVEDVVPAPAEDAKPVLIWRVARAERPVQTRSNFRAKSTSAIVDGEAAKPRFERKPKTENQERPAGDRPKFEKPKFDRSRFEKPKSADGKPDGQKFEKPKFDKPKFDKPKFEKPVDPDSPFAKLAALKERMKS
jgi:ATP-dependent RNA helicase SUPV3L1/SUV3